MRTMCIYTYVYIYICVYIYIYVCVYIYIHICLCVNIYILIFINIYIYHFGGAALCPSLYLLSSVACLRASGLHTRA